MRVYIREKMGSGSSKKVGPSKGSFVSASMMAATIAEQTEVIKALTLTNAALSQKLLHGGGGGGPPIPDGSPPSSEGKPNRLSTVNTHQTMAVGATTMKRVKEGGEATASSPSSKLHGQPLQLPWVGEGGASSPTTVRGICSICGESVLDSQPRMRDVTTDQ